MKSILEPEGVSVCYLCGCREYLELHHVINGNPGRKYSEHYGLKVHLCCECHRGKDGVHGNKEKRRRLQREAQEAFEKKYSREQWMEVFGRNYIEGEYWDEHSSRRHSKNEGKSREENSPCGGNQDVYRRRRSAVCGRNLRIPGQREIPGDRKEHRYSERAGCHQITEGGWKMQVTQCDKCGKIVENKATVKIREFKDQKVDREYDLCKECCGLLMQFLKGAEENE